MAGLLTSSTGEIIGGIIAYKIAMLQFNRQRAFVEDKKLADVKITVSENIVRSSNR